MTTSAIHFPLGNRWCRMLHIGWKLRQDYAKEEALQGPKDFEVRLCPNLPRKKMPLVCRITEIYRYPMGHRFKADCLHPEQVLSQGHIERQTSIHTYRYFKSVKKIWLTCMFSGLWEEPGESGVNPVRRRHSAASATSHQNNMCDIRSSQGLRWMAMVIHSVVSRKPVTWEGCCLQLLAVNSATDCNLLHQQKAKWK